MAFEQLGPWRGRLASEHIPLVIVILILSFPAVAQIQNGDVTGLVLDPSGAVIPQAKITGDLVVAANYAYHDARFTHYLLFDADANSNVDVAGKQLPLSPRHLASAGILYTPRQGLNSTLVVSYVGRRYLDAENVAPVGGYTKVDATLGYAIGQYQLSLEGTNLTNRRPPVIASEFGSESFYLLNARSLWVRCAYRRL